MKNYLTNRRQMFTTIGGGVAAVTTAAPATDVFTPATRKSDATAERWVEDFGAKGDGETDDTAAFERALATTVAGGSIKLTGGRAYRLTRTLVFTQPLVVTGGTKENTRLLFDDGQYAQLGGRSAAMIFPHERSYESRADITARRSMMSGFTVLWTGRRSSGIHGFLIAAPVYFSEVDVLGFPGDGFRIEAESEAIRGNANGSSFINCSAQGNRANGFAFYGNDANACLLLSSRSFDNGQAGFYDGSLLGNTYVAGEADGNLGPGYSSSKSNPNRSTYIGCYAEPNQRYDLNKRNLVVGALGHVSGISGAAIRALPSGELFSGSSLSFADSEDEATQGIEIGAAYLRMGREGIDLGTADGQRFRLVKLLSENYVDLLNGDQPLIRFPAREVAGNISAHRPWLPSGLVVGESGASGILGAGKAPPTEGKFAIGALWLNEAPQANGFVGWVCTASGRPGRWQPFGRIEDAR